MKDPPATRHSFFPAQPKIPEMRLVREVLIRAIEDLRLTCGCHAPSSRCRHGVISHEARAWFADDVERYERSFSFLYICDVLKLDPDAVRVVIGV